MAKTKTIRVPADMAGIIKASAGDKTWNSYLVINVNVNNPMGGLYSDPAPAFEEAKRYYDAGTKVTVFEYTGHSMTAWVQMDKQDNEFSYQAYGHFTDDFEKCFEEAKLNW